MKISGVLGLFLGIIGLVSALILAVVSNLVAGPIEQAELRNTNQALRQILPPFDNQPSEKRVEFTSPNGWPVSFMAAVKDGKVVAVAAEATNPQGYAGNIQALIGLETDGAIRAVLITKQNETPGLGANVCQRKVQKTVFTLFDKPAEGLAPNKILDQFDGKKPARTPTGRSKRTAAKSISSQEPRSPAGRSRCWSAKSTAPIS